MPSVYNYRHVELDRVGRGKRVIQPPGGQTADIFGSRPGGEPSYSSASSQAGSDVASSRVHIETDQQSIASSNQTPVDGLIGQQLQAANGGQVSPSGSVVSSGQQQSVLMADDYKPIPQQQQLQQQQYNILQQQQRPAASVQQQQQQQLQQQHDASRTPKKTIPVLRRNPITGEVYENPGERQQMPVRVRQPPGGTSSITF